LGASIATASAPQISCKPPTSITTEQPAQYLDQYCMQIENAVIISDQPVQVIKGGKEIIVQAANKGGIGWRKIRSVSKLELESAATYRAEEFRFGERNIIILYNPLKYHTGYEDSHTCHLIKNENFD